MVTRSTTAIITLIIFGIVALTAVIGVLIDSFHGDRMYRALINHSPVKRVELYISTEGNSDSGSSHVLLQNDTVCNEVNSTFKYFKEITPDRPRAHTRFIRMSIYKDRKIDLFISKTTYSGWVISIMNNHYKNDSLIFVLNKYAKFNE